MGVDDKTKPSHVAISIDKEETYLAALFENALAEYGQPEKDADVLLINNNTHGIAGIEIYFEEPGELHISFTLESIRGNTFVSVVLPISDTVLIDILTHAVKKLNKLKTAMESLK